MGQVTFHKYAGLTLTDDVIGVDLDPNGIGPALDRVIRNFMMWCETIKIPVVLAAGNNPRKYLHEQLPHRLGTPDNTILTVGGVNSDGTLYDLTSTHQAGQAGSMSVFAPAKDIIVPATGEAPDSGTSQAAAIVVCPFFSGLLELH